MFSSLDVNIDHWFVRISLQLLLFAIVCILQIGFKWRQEKEVKC
jgi:hypothetical protein